MGEKFRNKYRIGSSRMQNWDYGWRGQYYITICTRGRKCYFGEIIDGRMMLSEIGKIAKSKWLKTPEIRPDMNLKLDEYVIMPNHIHVIIQIEENEYNKFGYGHIGNGNRRRDAMHGVSTTNTPDKNNDPLQKGKNKLGPQRKNISSIMRGFKSSVTIDVRKINSDFGWQSRFNDHVIRDKESLNRIRRYIKDNPENWKEDKFNPKNEKGNKNKGDK